MINNPELQEKYKDCYSITTVFHPMFDRLEEGVKPYKFKTFVYKEHWSNLEAVFLDGELVWEKDERGELVRV